MTSRDKAIEALEIGDKVWERFNQRVVTLKENHRTDTTIKWWHIEEDMYEWREDSFTTIPYYVQELLSKPTLDDCIAVVEEMKRKQIFCNPCIDYIITALKGLKEGK